MPENPINFAINSQYAPKRFGAVGMTPAQTFAPYVPTGAQVPLTPEQQRCADALRDAVRQAGLTDRGRGADTRAAAVRHRLDADRARLYAATLAQVLEEVGDAQAEATRAPMVPGQDRGGYAPWPPAVSAEIDRLRGWLRWIALNDHAAVMALRGDPTPELPR